MLIQPIRFCCLALCLAAGPAGAARETATLCDDAARSAARDSATPLAVLLAITRVETGRGAGGEVHPWPWTINHAGVGQWFETADKAALAAEIALADGTGNLDIGCFQLNHRWHGSNFASLDQMLDPASNARYAAAFLSDLYAETGSWSAAVATYHSRSAGPAARYLSKIETVLASLDPPSTAPAPRHNSYPFLQSGSRGTGGSLVPRLAAARPLFGEPR